MRTKRRKRKSRLNTSQIQKCLAMSILTSQASQHHVSSSRLFLVTASISCVLFFEARVKRLSRRFVSSLWRWWSSGWAPDAMRVGQVSGERRGRVLTIPNQGFLPRQSLHFFNIDPLSQQGKLELDGCKNVEGLCSVGRLKIRVLVLLLQFWFWFCEWRGGGGLRGFVGLSVFIFVAVLFQVGIWGKMVIVVVIGAWIIILVNVLVWYVCLGKVLVWWGYGWVERRADGGRD